VLLLFAKRVREREHKHGRGGKKKEEEEEDSVRGFRSSGLVFSLFFYFFEKRGKGERESVCVVFALRFLVRQKSKRRGDFDLRETLVSRV
jgi:hypothetical protein